MKWKELFEKLEITTIKSIVADLKGYDVLPSELQTVLEKAEGYLKLATDDRDTEILINKNKKSLNELMKQIKRDS